jgi:protein disulfide-isomerase
LKKANEALQEKYKIEGYPTIIVLDGNGKKVGELGYQPGGPKAFIGELDKLKTKT